MLVRDASIFKCWKKPLIVCLQRPITLRWRCCGPKMVKLGWIFVWRPERSTVSSSSVLVVLVTSGLKELFHATITLRYWFYGVIWPYIAPSYSFQCLRLAWEFKNSMLSTTGKESIFALFVSWSWMGTAPVLRSCTSELDRFSCLTYC